MTPHPLAPLAQPVCIRNPAAVALPRAFILCAADKDWADIPFYRIIDQIRTDPDWRYREVDVTHIGPLSTPEPVARALLALIDS